MEGCSPGRGSGVCRACWEGQQPGGRPGFLGRLVTTVTPALLPQVVKGIEVYSTKISCKVTSRFAHNIVTTKAVNRADTSKEVSFDVELPKTAFITNFTL